MPQWAVPLTVSTRENALSSKDLVKDRDVQVKSIRMSILRHFFISAAFVEISGNKNDSIFRRNQCEGVHFSQIGG